MGLQSDHESGYFEEDEEVSEDETQKIEDAKKAAETNKGRKNLDLSPISDGDTCERKYISHFSWF
jgi:hypothetical protein